MGLFDAVLSAVSNPGQQASPGQLGAILSTVQQLSSNHGIDAGTTQTLVSVVGGYVQSALQQQQSAAGTEQVQSTVNQYSGTGANPQAVEAVLGPAMQQQVVQDLIQRTGLDPQTVESLLPTLVPLALNFLQSGQHTGNPQAGNPVLTAFLDGNHDGSLDLGDALNMAGQFFGR
ncbi:DUF937 domain-containing protein [Stenomitos frigidus]|uniref:DUF937 domain-containing protein n=1 Tax=Stenomitos frigidus ULC18 TaxID=2107698 RepID=A0A2T1E5Q3_9CYAN|nr:DUF937 domain-containing protein [Stenomitos frigidus]PSB28058.1 hypothetical protein C7B82_14495 [Stenomitos frigidus ULC18]